MFRATGPGHADLKPLFCAEPLLPSRCNVRRRSQIGNTRRDGLRPCLEYPRQAQQRTIAVGRGGGTAVAEKFDSLQACAHQPKQRLGDAQPDRCRACRKTRQIARELDRIAESLFGLYVDGPASNAFALPWPLRKQWSLGLGRAQSPLVLGPAFAEIAAHQQEDAKPGWRIGVKGVERDPPPQVRHALLV